MVRSPTREDLALVAKKLGDFHSRCFLTGGTSIPLYLSEALVEPPRVTYDIDVVIEVGSRADFLDQIQTQLRSNGFIHDMTEGAPACRWRLNSLIVDVMPIEEGILGFTNAWYKAGLSSLMQVRVTEDCIWRVLAPPFALASKFAAFWERGSTDPQASHDLEDIVSLLYGRREIMDEVLGAPEDCRMYLSECFSRILSDERLEDAIESHIFPDELAAERLMVVKEKMRRLRISGEPR